MHAVDTDRLVALRRDFHRFPEPAWREFYTTSRIVDELEAVGVDALAVGREAVDPEERMAVPDDEDVARWRERARDRGAREDVLARTEGGHTGAVARLDCGDGPHVALRVDIDGLFFEEATDDDHAPAAEGFRSEHEGMMHACGHDAHVAIGLGVLEAVEAGDFDGTLTVVFQPAEEESGGGKAVAESGHLDDVDYLFAIHVGLDHPTGEVVGGVVKPLAMSHVTATISGEAAHAGKAPNEGRNAIQAAATAVQNAYGIPRHEDGMTRVNVGRVEGGTASNVVAEEATLWGEVRGETTALREYVKGEFARAVESAAAIHDCEADVDVVSESPRADSDPELAAVVAESAGAHPAVDSTVREAEFGASEDATFLMERVQAEGGLAAYAVVGTDHPSSHHTSRFDVDEASLDVGVSVLADAVERVAAEGTTEGVADGAE